MKKRGQEASSTINEIPSNSIQKPHCEFSFHAVTNSGNEKRKTRDNIGILMVRQDQQESEVLRK